MRRSATSRRGKLRALYVEERIRVPQPDYVAAAIRPRTYRQFARCLAAMTTSASAPEASHVLNSEQLNAYNEIQQAQKEMREQFSGSCRVVSMPLGDRQLRDVDASPRTVAMPAFVSGAVAVPAPRRAAPKKP